MRSVILCEGSTDFILLQYYMRKVNEWEYKSNKPIIINDVKVRECELVKDDDKLSIIGCGGCSHIIETLDYVLDLNSVSALGECIDNIVIITDRDEVSTEVEFSNNIEAKMNTYVVKSQDIMLSNNMWKNYTYQNGYGDEQQVKLLLLVIPFEDTGAMETFLLNAIANNDEYDAKIISKCNLFVDCVDEQKRYLNKRRYVTKAKFDVYFSIRTSAEQFNERRDILKSVPWENYTFIQSSFAKLGEL
jgi:hypothetical protein